MFDGNKATDRDMLKNMSHGTNGHIRNEALVREELQRNTAQEQKQALKTTHLMEMVCHPQNLERAYKRVVKNKGAPGIDGMQVSELNKWLFVNKETLISNLLNSAYNPQPVKRVEIPKPGGGMRQLGIPTVVDRFVQQAVLQMLTQVFDPEFSNSSYGFRPGKSAHQALEQAKIFVSEGRTTVVDLDLEKFFDKVNHDILMSRVARKIEDKRILKLIRKFLQANIMINGLCIISEEGTPQGGPLSPLLANIMLDDLDKELERRGHKFCRYADDFNIYVLTPRAGERVMESVVNFLEKKLRLKVNKEKSAVDPSSETKIPGLPNSFRWHPIDIIEEY
jgi:RNA-directed DNA polymerase